MNQNHLARHAGYGVKDRRVDRSDIGLGPTSDPTPSYSESAFNVATFTFHEKWYIRPPRIHLSTDQPL